MCWTLGRVKNSCAKFPRILCTNNHCIWLIVDEVIKKYKLGVFDNTV